MPSRRSDAGALRFCPLLLPPLHAAQTGDRGVEKEAGIAPSAELQPVPHPSHVNGEPVRESFTCRYAYKWTFFRQNVRNFVTLVFKDVVQIHGADAVFSDTFHTSGCEKKTGQCRRDHLRLPYLTSLHMVLSMFALPLPLLKQTSAKVKLASRRTSNPGLQQRCHHDLIQQVKESRV